MSVRHIARYLLIHLIGTNLDAKLKRVRRLHQHGWGVRGGIGVLLPVSCRSSTRAAGTILGGIYDDYHLESGGESHRYVLMIFFVLRATGEARFPLQNSWRRCY